MSDHPSARLPDAKRRALLRAAAAEFAAHGFGQASLNRIIREVGMSKSSFYHFYADKSDLFRQTLDSALVPLLAVHGQVDIDALSRETLWPEVMRMAANLSQLVSANPEMVTVGRMFYRCLENPAERALIEGDLAAFTDWVFALLKRGQELGLFRDDLPETLLMDCLMALGMAVDRWMLAHFDENDEAERMALTAQAFDLFRRLLAPAG